MMTREEKIYCNASFDSQYFEHNCKRVWVIIFPLVVDTQAWPCFKKHKKSKDIFPAWNNFRTFYDGDTMHTKQMVQAREALLHLYYKNEHTLSFTTYVLELLHHFYMLELGKQGKREGERLRTLPTILKNMDERFLATI